MFLWYVREPKGLFPAPDIPGILCNFDQKTSENNL